MPLNILGPGGPNVNASAVRDPHVATGVGDDLWFKACVDGDPTTGTKIQAQWLNMVMAQLREAIRGMGVPEDEIDDLMLLKAIQAAGASKATQAEVDAAVNDTKFVTPLTRYHALAPAFLVEASGAQNIPSGVYTKILFQTTLLNNLKDSAWAAGVLTIGAKDAGVFLIATQANPNTSGGSDEGLRLLINGVLKASALQTYSDDDNREVGSISRICRLDQGNTVQVQAYHNAGASVQISAGHSYLTLARLGDST
jgi:hypothetical protein